MQTKLFLENLNKYWVTPIIVIVGGIIGVYFTIVKDSLSADAQRIENAATKIETEIKQREFRNNLKIQMFGEVKEAITKDDKKLQNAVLLLVNEMLADDSLFREQLITVLLSSPNIDASVIKTQKEIQVKTDEFVKEQSRVVHNKFTIDIFYLEDVINESKPRAEKLERVLKEKLQGNYQIRVRMLPRAINAKTGYRITANEIRYEEEEYKTALTISEIIAVEHIFELEKPRLKEINPSTQTPNYISIFVRNM